MPKINQEEYEVLKELDDKWKWIARNYNGALITYTDKPMKNPNLYWDSFGERMDDRLFQFIQWEDEEPYEIAELIEEYLYDNQPKLFIDGHEQSFEFIEESEEKEVKKDIEWLKETLEERIDTMAKFEDVSYSIGLKEAYQHTLLLINQLDEPEVLSEEWIDNHTDKFVSNGDLRFVSTKDLQNLLVPKRELPVIPQFVADWIEEVKPDNSLRVAFEYIAQRKRDNHDDELAFWVEEGNSEVFARAWLDGFTVEEEQRYRVSLHDGAWLVSDDNKNISKATTYFMHQEDVGFMNRMHEFTEQQINNVDTKYMAFAVKVKELEE